ncbi:MAG: GrpB family protein [Alphaproteobacteria bacterium]|nr:GrpB family protein [Alphaproteobacteria bacterium]MBL6936774.1 GrpB family protein [Alphaproteobacteria bacterium]MBL7097543.1 GrpB family protein [Alphaproteobacteria bacterium]
MSEPTHVERTRGPVVIVDYDPAWPRQYDEQERRIRAALGDTALLVEHVGSTSVPGLPAKPVLDINLVVPDTTREADYRPALGAAGFRFFLREPDWFEHRLFKGEAPSTNLHVFPQGCPEVNRMRLMRDWLRQSPEDLTLYADAKRRLAQQPWEFVQQYADAKSEVVATIMSHAEAWAASRA